MVQTLPRTHDPRTADDAALRETARAVLRDVYVPCSVYRVQMNRSFTFRQAAARAAYFRALGIGALYTSPYFQAAPGSPHGYNVTDPNALNPELGAEADYEAFVSSLKDAGIGHVIDIVPNHMGIVGNNNRLWNDVLENGPGSIYARFFDIDWNPVKRELKNKVLIPVLGDLYGRALEGGDIRLRFLEPEGELQVRYFEHILPLAPTTYPVVLMHGAEALERSAADGDPDAVEYLGIAAAFRGLAGPDEREPSRVAGRQREKEIAKGRLAALTARSVAARDFVRLRVELFNGRPGDPASFDLLDGLLGLQAYRLAHWRVASEEINYRRFFNVNELAALRVEDERVFRHCHALVFRLLKEGKAQALRVDHPDGLYDPPAYFERLQKEYLEARAGAGAGALLDDPEFRGARPLYVVAEKILDAGESLPSGWSVHGTVGYDFLNALNGLYVDGNAAEAFERIYSGFIEHRIDIDELIHDTKKAFATVHMASEIHALGHRLNEISERNRRFRDFTRNNLTHALREVIECFPVYRTYISPDEERVSPQDERVIRTAVSKARRRNKPSLDPAIYDFLQSVLLLGLGSDVSGEENALYRDFVLRFQQLTGSIMAKGLEDTAFYVNNRLLSLNEVGGSPKLFGRPPAEFHAQNAERVRSRSASFVTDDTHDAKRGQDVRMRLDVLSELPAEWEAALARWAALNERHKTEIDGALQPKRNTEYALYQTLLGAWPDGGDADEYASFRARVRACALKSAREGGIHTSWTAPDAAYEEALARFVDGVTAPGSAFLEAFVPFQRRVSALGKLNSLSALVLKHASPGVSDTYQGNELWNYALVDPDNRRPVDFAARARVLEEVKARVRQGGLGKAVAEWAADADSGRIKMYATWKLLEERRLCGPLYVGGGYEPLETRGPQKDRAVAFARRADGHVRVAAGGRFFARFEGSPVAEAWKDTRLVFPPAWNGPSRLTDVLTDRAFDLKSSEEGPYLDLSDIFSTLPAALLTGEKEAS